MITKEMFEAYVEVRQSGITNMFDVRNVMNLTRLSEHQIYDIMKNYHIYLEQFGDDIE